MTQAALLLCALAVDIVLGEPPAVLHPVVWMGRVITWCEKRIPTGHRNRQLLAGAAVALFVPSLFAALGWVAGALGATPMAWLVQIWLLKSTFALRALGRATKDVYRALEASDLPGARYALRSLCSRDPACLDAPLVVAATVESVAENASDAFIAPLCMYLLFGLPGALFYRAVNTLDARIGYHGAYEYFGKASARFDDLLNLVPARVTALLLLLSGWMQGRDARSGVRMWSRDARRTESPNAGRPMATMAGLLRVELVKVGSYRLGDAKEPLSPRKIVDAWRTVALAFAVGVATGLAILLIRIPHGGT